MSLLSLSPLLPDLMQSYLTRPSPHLHAPVLSLAPPFTIWLMNSKLLS